MKHLEKFTKLFVEGKTSRSLLDNWLQNHEDIDTSGEVMLPELLELSRRLESLRSSLAILFLVSLLTYIDFDVSGRQGVNPILLVGVTLYTFWSLIVAMMVWGCRFNPHCKAAIEFTRDAEHLYQDALMKIEGFKPRDMQNTLQQISRDLEEELVHLAQNVLIAERENRSTNPETEAARKVFKDMHHAASKFSALVEENQEYYFAEARRWLKEEQDVRDEEKESLSSAQSLVRSLDSEEFHG